MVTEIRVFRWVSSSGFVTISDIYKDLVIMVIFPRRYTYVIRLLFSSCNIQYII